MRGSDTSGAGDDEPGGAADPRPEGGEILEVYRTLPARILGWSMVVVVGIVGVIIVRSEYLLGADILVPSAGILFVIALVWVLLLRPAVELRSASVVSRNILRDTVVPFARLGEVSYQWSLELTDTTGRTWSSWAVPKQREFSARRSFDDFGETTRKKSRPGTTAQSVAGDVEREHQRWLLAGGTRLPDAPAHTSWAPQAVAPLLAALTFLLLAIALS